MAEIVTGASNSNENGLLSPPVRYNRTPNWLRSNNNDKIVALCDRRLLAGDKKPASRLNKIDAPIAIEQYPSSKFKVKKYCAATIEMIFQTIAIHLKNMSVCSLTHSLRI